MQPHAQLWVGLALLGLLILPHAPLNHIDQLRSQIFSPPVLKLGQKTADPVHYLQGARHASWGWKSAPAWNQWTLSLSLST